MKLSDSEDEVIERGQPPITMEPVRARIKIASSASPTVYVLDHDGLRTATAIPTRNGTFEIDGARDKTPYYLVEF